MKTGVVFDIKRYALHDGPGIRTTVFFKGCPLRCVWCHNPEGQSPFPELLVRPARCLEACHLCLETCPETAALKVQNVVRVDRRRCRVCGSCADSCPSEALALVGRRLSVEEAAEEIFRDEPFFRQSGGGVTFSGGEPLMQAEFLAELLRACRSRGVHTAVDTSGHVPWMSLESIREDVGLFLYDLKMMDDRRHRELTGVTNAVILENLVRLVRSGSRVVVRLPLLKGVNDGPDHVEAAAQRLSRLGGIERVDLLSYHALGRDKYGRLSRPEWAADFFPPTPGDLERIKKRIQAFGLEVRLGG
ncbi:MAG: glycyl-radical enzyme activating protein [Candidatus Aminicenantes bacterium]|nr:glycyl-radical enzyme activating protein [Candidatus Aminicenantes bacterium]